MLAGAVLMLIPRFFEIDIRSVAADIGHLGGALIVTVSVIAMGEVVRIGRYMNVLIGLVVAVGVWFAETSSTGYAATATVLAIAAMLLSIPRGRVLERYGAWDRYVR